MITTVTGSSGTSRCFHWSSSPCLRASRSLAQSTSASLANSLGCRRKGPPSSIQLRWPLTSRPDDEHRDERDEREHEHAGRRGGART